LVPEGPVNPSVIPKEFKSKRQLQIPFHYPSQRKGIYSTLEGKSPLFLSIDVFKCRNPNPNSGHGSKKAYPVLMGRIGDKDKTEKDKTKKDVTLT